MIEIEGQDAYCAEELMPHVDEQQLEVCEKLINNRNKVSEEHKPVFLNRKHFLSEVCASYALPSIFRWLTRSEIRFCREVTRYMKKNPDSSKWDISHINLEEDKMNTDMSDLIDRNIKSGSGLNIGDRLKMDNSPELVTEMTVVGFDSGKCPIVRYTKVVYGQGAEPSGEKEGDELVVGDILPFPWSNPAQYKI